MLLSLEQVCNPQTLSSDSPGSLQLQNLISVITFFFIIDLCKLNSKKYQHSSQKEKRWFYRLNISHRLFILPCEQLLFFLSHYIFTDSIKCWMQAISLIYGQFTTHTENLDRILFRFFIILFKNYNCSKKGAQQWEIMAVFAGWKHGLSVTYDCSSCVWCMYRLNTQRLFPYVLRVVYGLTGQGFGFFCSAFLFQGSLGRDKTGRKSWQDEFMQEQPH